MKCPKCGAECHRVPADEPWHEAYLICPVCDSTENILNKKLEAVARTEMGLLGRGAIDWEVEE